MVLFNEKLCYTRNFHSILKIRKFSQTPAEKSLGVFGGIGARGADGAWIEMRRPVIGWLWSSDVTSFMNFVKLQKRKDAPIFTRGHCACAMVRTTCATPHPNLDEYPPKYSTLPLTFCNLCYRPRKSLSLSAIFF